MAIYLQGVGANSFSVVYAGATLTDHVRSCTIHEEYDEVDVTAMGAVAHAVVPGLRQDSIDLEFYQDLAALSVDVTLNTYLGSTSGATLVIQSSGSTVSTTNPKWTVTAAPLSYQPINASVGEASTTTVTFKPVAGQSITRGTT